MEKVLLYLVTRNTIHHYASGGHECPRHLGEIELTAGHRHIVATADRNASTIVRKNRLVNRDAVGGGVGGHHGC